MMYLSLVVRARPVGGTRIAMGELRKHLPIAPLSTGNRAPLFLLANDLFQSKRVDTIFNYLFMKCVVNL